MKGSIKKYFSIVKQVWRTVDKKIIQVSYKNSLLASIYYAFWSSVFFDEHKAVLSGRVKYFKNIRQKGRNSILIRRNVHRLEKGMIMRPRKTIFATTYIEETIDAYSMALSYYTSQKQMPDEMRWAHDVLKEYFTITDNSNKIINACRERFSELPSIEGDGECKPFCRYNANDTVIQYEDLLKLSLQRRSVRWYKQTPVPRELIDKAIDVARMAPSACNRQPFKFLIFDDRAKIKNVANIPMGTKGFANNVPGIIAVVGDLSSFFHEQDRHVIYIDASLASMALLYALESQGVSSCVINSSDVYSTQNRIKKELGLQDYERVLIYISYGYADPEGFIPYSQKKSLEQLRSYNK
jgi:nitroreductase